MERSCSSGKSPESTCCCSVVSALCQFEIRLDRAPGWLSGRHVCFPFILWTYVNIWYICEYHPVFQCLSGFPFRCFYVFLWFPMVSYVFHCFPVIQWDCNVFSRGDDEESIDLDPLGTPGPIAVGPREFLRWKSGKSGCRTTIKLLLKRLLKQS